MRNLVMIVAVVLFALMAGGCDVRNQEEADRVARSVRCMFVGGEDCGK